MKNLDLISYINKNIILLLLLYSYSKQNSRRVKNNIE